MEAQFNTNLTSFAVTGYRHYIAFGFRSTTMRQLLLRLSMRVPSSGLMGGFNVLYVISGSYIRLKRPPTAMPHCSFPPAG